MHANSWLYDTEISSVRLIAEQHSLSPLRSRGSENVLTNSCLTSFRVFNLKQMEIILFIISQGNRPFAIVGHVINFL